jgi:hypothetical protein
MPGLTQITTASHGGYHVEEPALSQMPAALRCIEPWAGPGWYEEDEDWCLVALSLPDLFCEQSIFYAVRTAIGASYKDRAKAWLRTPAGKKPWARYCKYGEAYADFYERGSMGTCYPKPGWLVSWYRMGDRELPAADRRRLVTYHPKGWPPESPATAEALAPFLLKEGT